MDSLWRTLGYAPTRVPTDDVYPLHGFDDTKTLRGIVVAWTLRVDDHLDADKLCKSLSRLLDIGDWRKLGGRLRLNEAGALELHVPHKFSEERPAVAFSHNGFSGKIEDHELAKDLPRATENLSIQASAERFHVFAAREGAPKVMNDFIYHDVPTISLHVTTFENATLIGLSFPHVLMDALGQQALLRAWSIVLSGRESDVPPLLGTREDILKTIMEESGSDEELEIGKRQLKGKGLISFGLRYAWNMMTGPAAEPHTVYIPKTALESLRREALAGLSSTADGASFLSDNDVLTAWGAKIIASSQPQPRPVTVLYVVNTRLRLTQLAKASGLFVQNLAVAGFTLLGPAEAQEPLGSIALMNRQQMKAQTTEGQVRAMVRELRRDAAGGDPRILCGPSDAVLMVMTNWERADIFGSADFSGAVVRPGSSDKTGAITYHHAGSMSAPTHPNLFVVLGKDREGGFWLTAHLTPAAWDAVKASVTEERKE